MTLPWRQPQVPGSASCINLMAPYYLVIIMLPYMLNPV